MKLIIVRHGETVWNAEDKVQSLQHNSPYTIRGLQQIQAVAKQIKKIPNIDAVYTACLSRCIETVEKALVDKSDVPIVLEQLLQQRNWGTLTGMTRSQIGARFPDSGYDTRGRTVDKDKKYHFLPPSGETWVDVQHRLKKFLDRLFVTFTKDETVIIFTHVAISRALLSVLCNTNIWSIGTNTFGSVSTFTIRPDAQKNVYRVSGKAAPFRFKRSSHTLYHVTPE